MGKTIGIPRGMFYYDYYILWEEFFKNLNVNLLISPRTNKDILNRGISTCVDEACLPVKVFHGHVDYLKDKVDYIFIPKFISLYKREYCCPKHLGLPDMARHSIGGLPTIIEPVINLRKSKKSIKQAVLETGQYFTRDKKAILKAYNQALKKWKSHNKLIYSNLVPIDKIGYSLKEGELGDLDIDGDYRKSILLLGHIYNIYDSYINMDIGRKLKKDACRVVTAEMVEEIIYRKHAKDLPKRMFWTQGQRIVGATFALIHKEIIDGIIYVSSFGCGLDSVLLELVEKKAREMNIPFTLITIDEQTGEAGVNTRLEAFLDMLDWRDRDEANLSPYGECIYSGKGVF